jgi:diadenosine tetraphosphate (Ap4A) HIT family hydrolase
VTESPGAAPARPAGCPFCERVLGSIPDDGSGVAVFADGYPSAPGHTLVIPRRCVARLADLTGSEWAALGAAVAKLTSDRGPDGFTVGVNDGAAAGQTVPHVHVHVIPRRLGDTPDPRGGVRWVLPATAAYWAD